jgi:hypothetical protein
LINESQLSKEHELDLTREYGSIIKFTYPYDDMGTDVIIFKPLVFKDIHNIGEIKDNRSIFKRNLIFPELSSKEKNDIIDAHPGAIDRFTQTLINKCVDVSEDDYQETFDFFNLMDFKLYGTSGISVLMAIMGPTNADKVYDIVMNNDKPYIKKLTIFAARFTGMDEAFIKAAAEAEAKEARLNKTTKPVKPDPKEIRRIAEDPISEYDERKLAGIKDQVNESKQLLADAIKKDDMNKYRKVPASTIDFDNQNLSALQSGAISQSELNESVDVVKMFDPQGLITGSLTEKLLVNKGGVFKRKS